MNFAQKMLATALLALCLDTVQAQSSVTLYGIVDAGVQGATISAPNYSSRQTVLKMVTVLDSKVMKIWAQVFVLHLILKQDST
jgi:predicted porin